MTKTHTHNGLTISRPINARTQKTSTTSWSIWYANGGIAHSESTVDAMRAWIDANLESFIAPKTTWEGWQWRTIENGVLVDHESIGKEMPNI